MILALMALIDVTFWLMVERHQPPRAAMTVLGDINPRRHRPAN